MNKLLTFGVLVAILLGGAAFFKPIKAPNTGGVMPFLPTQELNLGGLRLVGKEKALATGTSTVCAIQSPSATSTLLSGGVKFTLASTSAVTVDLAKGNGQYATTTSIGSAYGVGASAQATIVASTTGSTAGEAGIFAPNKWFVAKFGSYADGTGNVSTGRCWAVWAVPQ